MLGTVCLFFSQFVSFPLFLCGLPPNSPASFQSPKTTWGKFETLRLWAWLQWFDGWMSFSVALWLTDHLLKFFYLSLGFLQINRCGPSKIVVTARVYATNKEVKKAATITICYLFFLVFISPAHGHLWSWHSCVISHISWLPLFAETRAQFKTTKLTLIPYLCLGAIRIWVERLDSWEYEEQIVVARE